MFREGTATAARCAELTGESVASCSYHLNILGKYGYIEQVPGAGKEKPWRSIDTRQDLSAPGPELEDQLAAEAATEAFLEHEFDRLRAWRRLRDTEPAQWRDATGLGGSTMWVTVEELQQIHDEIWPILERYTQRSEDPSLRPSDARAALVFVWTEVSPRYRGEPPVVSAPVRRRGGLWRRRDFGLFWAGESISQAGNSVTIVVMPLVAIETLHASTFIVTVLNAAIWLPWLIIGVPLGEVRPAEGNAKLMGSREVAQIGGPGLGGVLAQIAGPAVGLLTDAVSFGVSFACLTAVRRPPDRRPVDFDAGGAARAPLLVARPDPYLRVMASFSALANLALTARSDGGSEPREPW